METVWPGATSVRSLLAGAKVGLNQTSKAVAESLQGQKRTLHDTFSSERSSDMLKRQAFAGPVECGGGPGRAPARPGALAGAERARS
ncbi:hypothetical protein SCP_0105720 [Sparassis crispa]|uniref:Uncharacterized protein n=1 Tax=Sparassis crispa TaxID=139825 RepID=A0A401G697_9APHY|nr:hypothetical protein SCP_0105720 [Sparassis crispa]GBE77690.1 hypothetical protein SCP_0105720 [Sparassis crispa]